MRALQGQARWVVERTQGWLLSFAVAQRYDRSARTITAAGRLAVSLIRGRRLLAHRCYDL